MFIPSCAHDMMCAQTMIYEDQVISKISGQIEIDAGSDFYIKFNGQDGTVIKEEMVPKATGLSENEIKAVAKSPSWVQRKLIQQFSYIDDSDDYVDVILNSDLQYVDEISFSIAFSSLGNVPSAEFIYDNVQTLYQIDPFIQYADIVDYDDGNGFYFSTISYEVLENGVTKQVECPMDVYYWYVVHPRVTREDPMFIYEKTWRDYLFYHNDVGHPLLKEQVYNVSYLWDGTSDSHITGVHALQNWIRHTIRYEIIGDRHGQPNIIAHEHTGYCGETQILAVAAFRSSLIPIVGIMNQAEDHVWSEFYERGWYHYDGDINNPYMYTDGWGKEMSAIWAWKGDSSIYEVTAKYIHPEDRVTINFVVTDGYNNPVDGAIVTVLVKGLKDITFYKDYVLDILDMYWDTIPEFLKGRIMEKIYESFSNKIADLDEVIDAYQVSIWNYTDQDGLCRFELGKDDSYMFVIQKPDIKNEWPFYGGIRIKSLVEPENMSYAIRLYDGSNQFQRLTERNVMQGDYQGQLKVNVSAYQLQRNVITSDIGTYMYKGKIDFFIVDEENFKKYENGEFFDYFYFQEGKDGDIVFHLNDQVYYLVFRNHAHMTNVIVDYDLDIFSSDSIDTIQIVTPTTDLFDESMYTIGTCINISGIATADQIQLVIDNMMSNTIPSYDNTWQYQWDTTGLYPGRYLISVESNNERDEVYVHLVDTIPPTVTIISPGDMSIVENDVVTISGRADDNVELERVELLIDSNDPIVLAGKKEWDFMLDSATLDPGEHVICIIAYDHSGAHSQEEIIIVKNDSEQEWAPRIYSFFISPEILTNVSTVSIFSNVTAEGPFSIQQVILHVDNGFEVIKRDMFRYGDFPPQKRHIEDDIQNISNDPVYGIELGRFETGEQITFWIEAIDSAGNDIISEKGSFLIE